jgi:serine/threonine-protein kinase mTOR
MWHEGLEEASRLYYTEKNPDAMIAALEPLHDLLEKVESYVSPAE